MRAHQLKLDPQLSQVAKYPPLQKLQFDKYAALWPMVFHDVSKMPVFSKEEMQLIEDHMRRAILAAKEPEERSDGKVKGGKLHKYVNVKKIIYLWLTPFPFFQK